MILGDLVQELVYNGNMSDIEQNLPVVENLDPFNLYSSIEWNQTKIIWKSNLENVFSKYRGIIDSLNS